MASLWTSRVAQVAHEDFTGQADSSACCGTYSPCLPVHAHVAWAFGNAYGSACLRPTQCPPPCTRPARGVGRALTRATRVRPGSSPLCNSRLDSHPATVPGGPGEGGGRC